MQYLYVSLFKFIYRLFEYITCTCKLVQYCMLLQHYIIYNIMIED